MLVERLRDRLSAGEDLDGLVLRGLSEWLDLHDGWSDRGGAMAVLLDEMGATVRGELPAPSTKELADWLRLLNRVAGSDAANDWRRGDYSMVQPLLTRRR